MPSEIDIEAECLGVILPSCDLMPSENSDERLCITGRTYPPFIESPITISG